MNGQDEWWSREFDKDTKLDSGMVSVGTTSRLDNPGVCIHIHNDIQCHPTLLRTIADLLRTFWGPLVDLRTLF